MDSPFRKPLLTVSRLPAMFFLMLVTIYQKTLSPDHGPLRHLYPYGFCRHEPTCSDFARETLKTEPLFSACFQITKRVLSCHPWAKTSNERLKQAIKRSLQ